VQTKYLMFTLEEGKCLAINFIKYAHRWNIQSISAIGMCIDSHDVRNTALTSEQSNEIISFSVNANTMGF
jgi:hypothetical protein